MTKETAISTAYHEAAHFVVATHFGKAARPEVTPAAFSVVERRMYEANVTGLCHHAPIRSPLRRAILSWAGPLAESMFGVYPEWAPPFRPTAQTLKDWHSMALHQLDRFSDGDRDGILGCPRMSWRACRTAYRILLKNRARLKWLAEVQVAAVASQLKEEAADAKENTVQTQIEQPQPMSFADRAQWIKDFVLPRLGPDHRDRPNWLEILSYFEKGEEPPAHLFEISTAYRSASPEGII